MTGFAFRSKDFAASMTESNPDRKLIIAIDGPAASGKGTLAKTLAARLDFAYLDTGALYRAVGYAVLNAGGNPGNANDAERGAELVRDKFTPELLNNPELRSDVVGQAASQVAAFPGVRDALLGFQREFAKNPPGGKHGAVLDGRDIGTVICPGADIKLYVTANPEVRAERRVKDLADRGIAANYRTVLEEMKNRDTRDSGRVDAPLKKADDAFVIDTSGLTASQVAEQALALVRARMIEENPL